MAADSGAALVFSAWYRELTRLVYADELGELFRESWEQRGAFMISVMKGEGAYARRGGLAQWRSEVQLQRELRRIGFTSPMQYLRNVAVRGTYRFVPEPIRKRAYRRLIARGSSVDHA